jgi:hypothetical protein
VKFRAGCCAWDDKPCDKACPIPSVDNFGNPYYGCPRFRLKSMAEIEEMAKVHGAKEET